MVFFQRGHNPAQILLILVLTSGTYYSAELTEVMAIKCSTEGHNIFTPKGIEPALVFYCRDDSLPCNQLLYTRIRKTGFLT